MKTFYASIGIFLIVIAMILGNALYINRVTHEIERRLWDLPPCEDAVAALDELQAYWDKNQLWIEISVSSNTVWQMRDGLAQMKAASAEADAVEFGLSRALVYNTNHRIRRGEQFSIENLF